MEGGQACARGGGDFHCNLLVLIITTRYVAQTTVCANALKAEPSHTDNNNVSTPLLLLSYFNPSSCLLPPPQLLEYVGKGRSIMDVGLAQARQPLTTRRHYYELEIVDAGEKCYIALGLARRVSVLVARSTQCRSVIWSLRRVGAPRHSFLLFVSDDFETQCSSSFSSKDRGLILLYFSAIILHFRFSLGSNGPLWAEERPPEENTIRDTFRASQFSVYFFFQRMHTRFPFAH